MNPLCCIAPVSLERGDRGNPSPVVELKSAKPALGAESPTRNSSSKRLIQAPAIPPDSDAAAACHEAAEESAAVAEGGDGRGVNGAVAGILWKWVNFGKGWRSRWFVLQDGVLSYYKVHGPDRILMGPVASEAGVRVIGEESLRRVRKEQQWGNVGFARQGATKQWKPFGEVHLKVRLRVRGLLATGWYRQNRPLTVDFGRRQSIEGEIRLIEGEKGKKKKRKIKKEEKKKT
ncbi:hypothetical protein BHM03_00030928 [Ensete ventricosum]|nr:hypothetical protein BHM03_00030928 [Ensete ventricosum]